MQILTISEKHIHYAKQIKEKLSDIGVRVEMDTGDDTIGKKLRTHRAMRLHVFCSYLVTKKRVIEQFPTLVQIENK